MADGSLKKKAQEGKSKSFKLSDNDLRYIKSMEDLKMAVVGMVEMYINQAQVQFLNVKAQEKGVAMSDKKYKFDLDLESSEGIVKVEEA